MVVLISLVVCLSNTPAICETVTPDYVRTDSGAGPTLLECLGASGQDIAGRGSPITRATSSAASGARPPTTPASCGRTSRARRPSVAAFPYPRLTERE